MIVFKNDRTVSFYNTVSYKLCKCYMLDSIDIGEGISIIIYPINNNFLKRRGLHKFPIKNDEYEVKDYVSRWPKAYSYNQVKGI